MESTVTTWKGDDFEAVVEKLAIKDGDVVVATYPGLVSAEITERISEGVRVGLERVGLSRVVVLVVEDGLTIESLPVRKGDTLLVTCPDILSLAAQVVLQRRIKGTLANQGLPGVRVVVVDRGGAGRVRRPFWQKIKHALAI